MKDFLSYTVEDFVTDESYLRYYFREDEQDIRFWTEWIGLHPEKLDVIISANNYIDALSARLPESEFQKEQQRFASTLSNLSPSAKGEHRPPNPHSPTAPEHRPPGANPPDAAVLRPRRRQLIWTMTLLVSLAGSLAYLTLQKNKVAISGKTANSMLIEKYVPKGQQARITLPDGSEVELNADSKITYPSKFTGAARELQLVGEAFFRVRPDSLHPFHVISANLAVTVLGTAFNIRSYPNRDQIKVALVTGKVRLDHIGDNQTSENQTTNDQTTNNKIAPAGTLILTPSEMGVFDRQNLSLTKRKYDIDEETGWRRGTIVFRNAGFDEIADRFDKVYNIRLINNSRKTEFKFKGTFSNPSPEEIVKSICLSKQLSYEINGNVITIH